MFSGCSGLINIDLSGLDTSHVTDMSYMFSGCSGLTSINLSGFDISRVLGTEYMFFRCNRLKSVDLSGFDMFGTSAFAMFRDCSGLQSIKTPRNLDSRVLLPSKMFNKFGNEYSSLPEGLSESITLVKGQSVNKITLDQTNIIIEVGEALQLYATVSLDNADNKSRDMDGSNGAIAVVDTKGLVTGKATGKAEINVITEDGGYIATCYVTVNEKVYVRIALDQTAETVTEGDSFTLTATVTPGNATNKNVGWVSSDANIATVTTAGKVTWDESRYRHHYG